MPTPRVPLTLSGTKAECGQPMNKIHAWMPAAIGSVFKLRPAPDAAAPEIGRSTPVPRAADPRIDTTGAPSGSVIGTIAWVTETVLVRICSVVR